MGNGVGKKAEKSLVQRANSQLSSYSTDNRHVVEPQVLIGSFNIQRFGQSKMSDPKIVEILTKIICRYDILLVLEIVDTSGVALKDLLHRVNENWTEICEKSDAKKCGKNYYKIVVSPRIGKTKAKEQSAFFYRVNRFQVKSSLVYDDSDAQLFFREPFIVHFVTTCLANFCDNRGNRMKSETDFAIIGLHVHPKNANQEIDKLDDVKKWTKKRLLTSNVMIMGDLNASAPYVSAADWTTNRLKTDPDYHWLIPDHMVTTVHHAMAAYDRIIFCGDQFNKIVIPNSAKTFRYNEQEDFKPMEQDLLFKISDHYPVEVKLQTRMHPVLEESVKIFEQVVVLEDTRKVNSFSFSCKNADSRMAPFTLNVFYSKSKKLILAELAAKFDNMAEAAFGLKKLRQDSVLPYSLFALATAQMKLFTDRDTECLIRISFKIREDKTTIVISQPKYS